VHAVVAADGDLDATEMRDHEDGSGRHRAKPEARSTLRGLTGPITVMSSD
jgi:hypothetical protein